jgi:hypothetical protein
MAAEVIKHTSEVDENTGTEKGLQEKVVQGSDAMARARATH